MTETQIAAAWVFGAAFVAMLPSYVLYKALPSSADVSGPLHGFTFKIGGAAACYVVVLVILLYARPVDAIHYDEWTIAGSIVAKPARGEDEPNLNDVVVRIVPPRLAILNGGQFEWQLPIIEDAAGRRQFPMLQIDLPGYRGVTLPIGPMRQYGALAADVEYDESKRLIYIRSPITLESKRSVQAYAPVIAPTATPDDRNTAAAAAAAEKP